MSKNKRILESMKQAALDIADHQTKLQRTIDNQRAHITEQHNMLATAKHRLALANHRLSAMDRCIAEHVIARKRLVRLLNDLKSKHEYVLKALGKADSRLAQISMEAANDKLYKK